jgi:hypothetical protein
MLRTVTIVPLLALIGCGNPPRPVAFAQACEKGNHERTIEVAGYLGFAGPFNRYFCSNHGRCALTFTETPGAADGIVVGIDIGTGPSTMERPASGASSDAMVLRDDAGGRVGWRDKIKLTALVKPALRGDRHERIFCRLEAKKISR